MEGQLSKYFMYRALTERMTYDVWVWVGGCPCGSVSVLVYCVLCCVCGVCVVSGVYVVCAMCGMCCLCESVTVCLCVTVGVHAQLSVFTTFHLSLSLVSVFVLKSSAVEILWELHPRRAPKWQLVVWALVYFRGGYLGEKPSRICKQYTSNTAKFYEKWLRRKQRLR